MGYRIKIIIGNPGEQPKLVVAKVIFRSCIFSKV